MQGIAAQFSADRGKADYVLMVFCLDDLIGEILMDFHDMEFLPSS